MLNYLGNSQNYEIIAATHDIELATLLEYQYKNFHFNETIYENEIAFDFKIKPGKADTRNAIELLRILKFLIKYIHVLKHPPINSFKT